jgi:hypothetical protein
MQRASTVSYFVQVFVAAAALAAGAMACGSSNGNSTGAAGSGGGGSGGGGAGGGKTCTLADVNAIVQPAGAPVPYTGCVVINACHDNAGSAAGLDLTTAGWQTKLVGQNPVANKGASASLYSMCVGHGPYLVAGSNPAAGLFIDKLKPGASPPCGVHMPNLGAMLSNDQFACIQSYLTTLTSP